ncbi:hypothetical protein LuPra_05207 [Luteitalea pratensis]|uniref:Uncharacterized protein n=1 Tax=Luteitalea pratensis TaxID=1855912 RepID=A0A143PT82_LUTPR|nr:hypothetical protein [Luteitalea pratensis]AMY11937.1 hypothetical protein LuPra_05207 [Luteitalea pratensis]
MLHAGLCMVRQYCAFAGIAHGHNAREFFARLVERRIATPYTAAHRRARLYHAHHRRLYTAIGEPHSRFRKPLPVGRAMERLMMLDAVLEQPSIPWLATERDKWDHFVRTFGTSLTLEWPPQLRFGTPPHITLRYFPDRQPIGVVEADQAYTFLYLATKPWTTDLHAFLQRHVDLLRSIRRWTVRVLLPPHLFGARESLLQRVVPPAGGETGIAEEEIERETRQRANWLKWEGIDRKARPKAGAERLMPAGRKFPELQRGELSREGIEPNPATSRN